VSIVMVALDCRFLVCAVHVLILTIGPGMLDLGQPMFDGIFLAAQIEHMRRSGGDTGPMTANSVGIKNGRSRFAASVVAKAIRGQWRNR
jgi:hypothetical protein